MTFDLPNEHPLARHISMCRAHNQLPLITRPIRDIERTLQVTYRSTLFFFFKILLEFMLQPAALVIVILRFRLEFAIALALQGLVAFPFFILFYSFPTSAVLDGLFITRVHAFE
jgi:hypothetical protein